MLRTNGQFNAGTEGFHMSPFPLWAGDKKLIYLMTGPRLYENPGACFTKHM